MQSAIGANLRCWRAQPLFWSCQFVAIMLLATACDASAKEVKQEREFRKLSTVGGLLVTTQVEFSDDSWVNRIQIDGTTIFEDSSARGFIGIEASYPSEAPAQLILLSFNTNATACEMYLRVLETRGHGSYVISNQFGNCWPPADLQRYKKIKENPTYQNGAWYIALPPVEPEMIDPAHWTKFDWYEYRNGKVTKRAPGLPEK